VVHTCNTRIQGAKVLLHEFEASLGCITRPCIKSKKKRKKKGRKEGRKEGRKGAKKQQT
jgi:hypothetical protein